VTDPGLPDLPDPGDRRDVHVEHRPVVLAAVIGGGIALALVIIGITVLGVKNSGINEVSTTGLASIGSTLAGGFAGWIARGTVERERR